VLKATDQTVLWQPTSVGALKPGSQVLVRRRLGRADYRTGRGGRPAPSGAWPRFSPRGPLGRGADPERWHGGEGDLRDEHPSRDRAARSRGARGRGSEVVVYTPSATAKGGERGGHRVGPADRVGEVAGINATGDCATTADPGRARHEKARGGRGARCGLVGLVAPPGACPWLVQRPRLGASPPFAAFNILFPAPSRSPPPWFRRRSCTRPPPAALLGRPTYAYTSAAARGGASGPSAEDLGAECRLPARGATCSTATGVTKAYQWVWVPNPPPPGSAPGY